MDKLPNAAHQDLGADLSRVTNYLCKLLIAFM